MTTIDFALALLLSNVLAGLAGWSMASVYQLNKFRKQWQEMSERSAVFDKELAEHVKSHQMLTQKFEALKAKYESEKE